MGSTRHNMVRTEETERYKLTLLEVEDEIKNNELVKEFEDQPTVRVEGEEMVLIVFLPLVADRNGSPVILGKLKPETRHVVLAVTDQPPEMIPVISHIIHSVKAEAHMMGLEFTLLNDQVKEMANRAGKMKGKQYPGKSGLS